MSRVDQGSSALAALVLVACAHGGSTAVHVPAGRAAQPFGWPERLVDVSEVAKPVTVMSAPGGRAAQPFGWPESLAGTTSDAPSKAPVTAGAPATAYHGGRAAQPFGWPEQLIAQEDVARQGSRRETSTAAIPGRRRLE
jgi:hypothetical protein